MNKAVQYIILGSLAMFAVIAVGWLVGRFYSKSLMLPKPPPIPKPDTKQEEDVIAEQKAMREMNRDTVLDADTEELREMLEERRKEISPH